MQGFVGEVLNAFVDLVSAPFKDVGSLWYLLPIVVIWVAIEFYYDKMDDEKASYGSALAHGISVFWISIMLLRAAIMQETSSIARIVVVVLLLIYSGVVSYLSLLRKLGPKIAHLVSAPNVLYLVSIFLILWINNLITVNIYMVVVLAILAVLLSLLDFTLKKLLPKGLGGGLGGLGKGFGGGLGGLGGGGSKSDPFGKSSMPPTGKSDYPPLGK